MSYICLGCLEEVDPDDCEEVDIGGYEDFWGASVWHPCIELLSPCCGESIGELLDE